MRIEDRIRGTTDRDSFAAAFYIRRMIDRRTICLTICLAWVSLLAMSVGTAASAADAANFAGKYTFSKDGYRQQADIARTAAGYSVSIVVGTEGCSGAFDGVGAVQTGKLIAHATDPDFPDDKCRIEISRTAHGIAVDENDCQTWHGPSCGFDGTLRKR
jgi:hypothetical protein